jgi:trimethylamine--corrinoid protein Co-methyltransferase
MGRLDVVTTGEVESIHLATLRVLSEIGIVLTHAKARALLTAAGAAVRGDRVLFPPTLVEQVVEGCPRQVAIRGRDGQPVVIGDGSLHWHNLGGARDIHDTVSEQRRPAVVQDVRDSTRLLDALDSVSTITPLFTPHDVPGPLTSLAMYRHTIPHTTKPVQGPAVHSAHEVYFMAELAAVLGPPPEVLTLGISPMSPLFFPDDVAEAILETANLGIPLGPLPGPIAGETSPMSLAGSLAQQNAEILAAVVLAQLERPGLPMVYCGRLSVMEPRTGLSVSGAIEVGLASAATVQLGHRYGLPVNVYGLSTNAHVADLQNGYERALGAVIPALSGADELSGIGEMGAGVASSYVQIIVDNEIAAGISRVRRGLSVDDEALAVEVVRAAMDGPRHYLDHPHTIRCLRAGEVFVPRLAERRPWEEWNQSGQDGIIERAEAEARRLLAEHEPAPLAEEQERELDDIMAVVHQKLAGA